MKYPEIFQNTLKYHKIPFDTQKYTKYPEIPWNIWKYPYISKYPKNAIKYPKSPEIAKKYPKMPKITQNTPKFPKSSSTTKNTQICLELSKIAYQYLEVLNIWRCWICLKRGTLITLLDHCAITTLYCNTFCVFWKFI